MQTETFKRGEALFRAGDRFTAIYIIQSGMVSVRLEKEGNIELYVAGAGQSLCDEALFAAGMCPYGALALKDTTVIKIPLEIAKRQLSDASPLQKQILKGYSERLKGEISDLKNIQGNRKNQHCPPTTTSKLFGTIFHVAKERGTLQGNSKGNDQGNSKDAAITISWEVLKERATRVYNESSIRLEQGLFVLAKLGYADIEWERPGERLEGTHEPKTIVLRNMTQIESFFEFYQNYLYKPGAANILKTDAKVTAVTKAFLQVADKHPVRRDGMVHMPYKEAIDDMKAILGPTFEAEQIFRLEQKGLMVKRTSSDKGGTLSFFRQEFDQMLLTWSLLREIEQWNEHGIVDLAGYKARGATSPAADAPTAGKPTAQEAAQPEAPARSIKEIVASWIPAVLARKVPTIRMAPPAPGEKLCTICMSDVSAAKDSCPTCDNPIDSSSNQAA